tara:strand:- start:1272 stop:1724 length:453 start_codon:yes stop_codon:yes gene_type:complete
MINILLCNDDVLQRILKLYIEHYLNCKKDITNNNLNCCKQIYYLYKNLIKYCKCNILYIKNINYKICSYHDNISFDFVKSLLEQIDIVNRNILNNYMINYGKEDDLLFIHVPNIKQYKSIVQEIISKYNYKISHFCCGGEGCKLKKLVKI